MEKLCIKKCKNCKGSECPNYFGGDMHDKYLRIESYYEAPLHLQSKKKKVISLLSEDLKDVLYQIDEEEEEEIKKKDMVCCTGNETCLYKHPTINKLNLTDKMFITAGIIFWFITQICGNLI